MARKPVGNENTRREAVQDVKKESAPKIVVRVVGDSIVVGFPCEWKHGITEDVVISQADALKLADELQFRVKTLNLVNDVRKLWSVPKV